MFRIKYVSYLEDDLIRSAETYATYSWNRYYTRPESLPKELPSLGFWPKLNDTCLVILDKSGVVSLFALKQNGMYIFWDPYWNSSWVTIFIFNEPITRYPTEAVFKQEDFAKRIAESQNRSNYSYYHCSIKIETFWNTYKTN